MENVTYLSLAAWYRANQEEFDLLLKDALKTSASKMTTAELVMAFGNTDSATNSASNQKAA